MLYKYVLYIHSFECYDCLTNVIHNITSSQFQYLEYSRIIIWIVDTKNNIYHKIDHWVANIKIKISKKKKLK